MALYLLLGLSVLFALRALVGWRKGLMLMIVMAAIQDPLRKLVPGTPGWLVLATAPIFLASVSAAMSGTRHRWRQFRREFPGVSKALMLLPILSLPAAYLSASYGPGSWMLTIFGAFSYSLIFLAMVIGYHYARDLTEVRKLLRVYCLVNGVMLIGGLLDYSGSFTSWPIVGTQALGYEWIRWGSGYTVTMISGFYRTPDVMGWHAAAVCILAMILATTGSSWARRSWLLLSVFAFLVLLLCGRRKMVYMLPVFLVALVWIYWQAGRAARMIAFAGLLAIPALGVWMVSDWVGEGTANIRYYSGEGLQQDAFESIQAQGFDSVIGTFQQSGFFGQGLGFATPGSHNLDVARPQTWQESAPSRVVAELGVPGSLGFAFVFAMIVLSLWKHTLGAVRARTKQGQYAAGLMAFFLANVGSLAVSGQILADPFIGAFLGLLVGITLATPKLPGAKDKPTSSQREPVGPHPAGLLSERDFGAGGR